MAELLDVERWKTVDEFPRYKVSTWGRVWSNRSNLVLSPKRQKNGYLTLCLYLNGVSKMRLVHRLVAIAFLRNQRSLPQVDHIDGDRTNNALTNLRWSSGSENRRNVLKPRSASGVVGVFWCKTGRKWVARIRTDGKQVHLGCFVDKDRAELARLRAELERDPVFMPAVHKTRLDELEKKFKATSQSGDKP